MRTGLTPNPEGDSRAQDGLDSDQGWPRATQARGSGEGAVPVFLQLLLTTTSQQALQASVPPVPLPSHSPLLAVAGLRAEPKAPNPITLPSSEPEQGLNRA